MNCKSSILHTLIFLLFTTVLHAQLQVGGGAGQGTGASVGASEVTSGGFAGDVSLFTGTYNSSYTLGTVSTNSGISFTATMTHSSTYTSGDNMPNVSGIPYGEGWNLDVPMITTSVEDYNKFSILDSYWRGIDGNTETYFSQENNCNDVYEEGRLYWYAPTLNIPGVASGRMVYKYSKANTYYFVLHKFDRYIEARFTGTRWEVYLDDGTIYEFDAHMVAHRSASNQRVEDNCHGGVTPGIDPGQGHSVSNLILPKTEMLSWHCTQIRHRNLVGRIGFRYEKYGEFDFHKVLKQDLTERDVHTKYYNGNNNRASLRKAYKDIFLVQISSSYERLVLDYEAIPFPSNTNLLDLTDPEVEAVDNLYAKKVVREWDQQSSGFNKWFRYKHIKHPDILTGTSTISPTNPYVGTFSGGTNQLRRELIGVGGAAPFDHCFLESPRIIPDNDNMPFGDLYELETTIHTNWGTNQGKDCLFDINLGTGDNTSQPSGGGPVNSDNVEASDFFRTRGEAVYTTFNKAMKWYNFAEDNPHGQFPVGDMTTSDFFMMPNLPNQYQGFNIQIGPANSDNQFDFEGFSGEMEPNLCESYHERRNDSNSSILGSGDDIPNNFGIGAPWYMMVELYAYMNTLYPGIGFCESASADADDVWWSDGTAQMPWANIPTLANDEIELRNVKLIRYGKIPYMLKSARKQVFNTGTNGLDVESLCDTELFWQTISNLKFEYDHLAVNVYNTYVENAGTASEDVRVQPTGQKRNIFLLARIVQLPSGVAADAGASQMLHHPTTQFTYNEDNAAEVEFPGANDQFINTNFSVIRTVTDPLGKITTIDFQPITSGSYGKALYSHTPRPHETYGLASGGSRVYSKSDGYAFQIYKVVDKVSVEERDGTKSWNYDFSNFRTQVDENIPMDRQFRYDSDASATRVGFQNTTVTGPYEGSTVGGPSITYTHETSDLFWGKVSEVETRDAAGNLISRNESQYDAVIAFEPASNRASISRHTEWDYYDYYDPYYERPTIDGYDFETLRAYSDEIKNWIYLMDSSNPPPSGSSQEDLDAYQEYLDWVEEGNGIEPPALVCTNIPPQNQDRDCNCGNYENLTQSDQNECDRYWTEHSAWVHSRPSTSINFFRRNHPDIQNSGGLYDTPDFYESRYTSLIEKNRPRYLYSFFIKKTEDRQTVYEPARGGCDASSVETLTTYEYFDADYRGVPQTPDAFASILQSNEEHLYYEPSWQLFRKKTVSSELPDAYTQQEFYYLYDLLNNSTFHFNASSNDHSINDNIFELFDIYHNSKLRTLAYETRTTTKAPGEQKVSRSTYFVYRDDFEPEHGNVVYEVLETNPCTEAEDCFQPQDEEPESGSNTNPGSGSGIRPDLYTRDGNPCYHISSGYAPDYYNCPHEDFPAYICDCGIEESSEELPAPAPDNSTLNVANLIGGNLYLKEVHTQVRKGLDIMSFDPITFEPIFPYAHLKTNEVLSRNIWGQVVRERNERDIVTHYDYGDLKVYEYPYCWDGYEYIGRFYTKNTSGQPERVTVGAGAMPNDPLRDDALTTSYTYNMDHTIASITDPNGMVLNYGYDDYKRMNSASRNGEEIQTVSYSNWDNTPTDFGAKAGQNNVATQNFVEPGLGWSTVAYVDPLGRNVANERAGVMVEDNIYDIYDQPMVKLKPHYGSAPTVNGVSGLEGDHAEFLFDTPGRSRVLKSAKYGESLSGSHVVSNIYCLVSSNNLQAALNVANQNQMPFGSVFFKTQTTDEDGKSVEEYTNSIGQKVATITNNGDYATVFIYDSHGNVKESHNPKNQVSTYNYNYLGLLHNKVTVDGGSVNYGYDHSGNLLSEQTPRRITMYEYDDYGRMTGQLETQSAYYGSNGTPWTLTTTDDGTISLDEYKTIIVHPSSLYEKKWFYNGYDVLNESAYSTNAIPFLQTDIGHALGRLVQTVSYDLNEEPIEYRWMSYTIDGFLDWEMMQLEQPQDRLVKIDYPSYNLQGSYKTQDVDLNADGVLDFQYQYTYDPQNRIYEVYVNYESPGTGSPQRVVEYFYDDVMDVVSSKKYYDQRDEVDGQSCAAVETEVDHIQYSYDDRFRMRGMDSHLFNYALFYDGNHPPISMAAAVDNYNGNINGIIATYKTNQAANGTDALIMGGPTTYRYFYDNLNRLTEANAMVENTFDLSNQQQWGDTRYAYDEVGNFTSLERWIYDGNATSVTVDNFAYDYTAGTNQLERITDASPNDRTFQYDPDGNIAFDSKKQMSVSYGRANLPWQIGTGDLNGNTYSTSYLYDAADARIFKTVTNATTGTTKMEYYIRSAGGQELAIYDLTEDKLTWYVYGNERVAKIDQESDVDFEEPVVGPCDPNPPACDPNMIAQQQTALSTIRANMANRNTSNVGVPSVLYRLRLCDGTEFHLLADELSALPGNYMLLQVIHINSAAQVFAVAGDGLASIVDLAGLLQARVNDENVYINGYEPCIPENLCHDTPIYPAHSVGASTIISSSYNDPPYLDMTQVHPNANLSLAGDDNYWLSHGYTSGEDNFKREAEWDVSYDFGGLNSVQINSYKVHMDYWTGCTGNERAEIALYDGQELLSINGGYLRMPLSCMDYPEGRLTIIPDQPLTAEQVGNMRLAIYRSNRLIDRILIDLVEAELDYSYICPCQAPAPTCYASGAISQATSLNNLSNSISVTKMSNIELPTNLYRVRYCDGSEYNVLRQEMSIVDGAGRILQKHRVKDANQLFTIEQNGVPTDVTFSSLIDIRKNDQDIPVSNPCNPEDGYSRD